MRLAFIVIVACHAATPAKPDPPGATKWTSNTNQTVGTCHVGVANIFVRDGVGMSATFAIQEADGGERHETVKDGSVVIVCGQSIRVVRVDESSGDAPGSVFVSL